MDIYIPESFTPAFAVSEQTLTVAATTYFMVQLTSHQTKLDRRTYALFLTAFSHRRAEGENKTKDCQGASQQTLIVVTLSHLLGHDQEILTRSFGFALTIANVLD